MHLRHWCWTSVSGPDPSNRPFSTKPINLVQIFFLLPQKNPIPLQTPSPPPTKVADFHLYNHGNDLRRLKILHISLSQCLLWCFPFLSSQFCFVFCCVVFQQADVEADVTSGQPKKRTFKKFSYRGVDLDALLDMSTDELVKLFNARPRRRYFFPHFHLP